MEKELEILKSKHGLVEKEYATLKEKYEGGGLSDLNEISEKLYKLDPSAFRNTMRELNYTGEEPHWVKGEMKDDIREATMGDDPGKLK